MIRQLLSPTRYLQSEVSKSMDEKDSKFEIDVSKMTIK